MNARFVTCLFAIGFAGAVSAQEATPDGWMNVPSKASRADVVAAIDHSGPRHIELHFTNTPTSMSRTAVQQELSRARASGEYGLINAEASPLHRLPGPTLVGAL
jgi:hypothetical protein